MYFLRYLYLLAVVCLLTLFLTSNTDLYVLRLDLPVVDLHFASPPLPTFAILVLAFVCAFILVWFGHTVEQLRREVEVRRLRRENVALAKEAAALNQQLEELAASRETEAATRLATQSHAATGAMETPPRRE
ncbi:MAG: hypothetical protein COW73_09670 [Nitrospirae bacterium CG18_big_fil_WC_8_21_14_2_50_70_55]|nr:MAG: hypothetical protein COW73_09670 [Nitrospirae bacterium CG18_big_fil_WC_8_21_14_2_50_70_55]